MQLTFCPYLYKKEWPEQKMHFLIFITVHNFRIADSDPSVTPATQICVSNFTDGEFRNMRPA